MEFTDKSKITFTVPRRALGKDLSGETFVMCSTSNPEKTSGSVEVSSVDMDTMRLTWWVDKAFLLEDGTAEDFELRCSSMNRSSSVLWKTTNPEQLEGVEDALNQCSVYTKAAAISEEKTNEYSQGVYTALEKMLEAVRHPPIPNDTGTWNVWNSETGQYEKSDIPLPSGGGNSGTMQFIEKDQFPAQGDVSKLYIDQTANKIYRWDDGTKQYVIVGSDYLQIKQINGGNANG